MSQPRIKRWSVLLHAVRTWDWSPIPILGQLASALEHECKHIDELERQIAELKAREGALL
jgi:hypothetical protein